ncbi:MAG: hypothetical protein PVG13_03900 [Thiohalophilus sp.]
MSFLTNTVQVPLWLLILMLVFLLPAIYRLGKILLRLKQTDLVTEEQDDSAIWTVKNRIMRSVAPKTGSMTSEADEKKHEQKRQIAQILKILLKEGEKGVLMKTVADRIGTSILDAQHAMNKLMEKQMVEEITSVSGTKYYLTEIGKAYCRSKAK